MEGKHPHPWDSVLGTAQMMQIVILLGRATTSLGFVTAMTLIGATNASASIAPLEFIME